LDSLIISQSDSDIRPLRYGPLRSSYYRFRSFPSHAVPISGRCSPKPLPSSALDSVGLPYAASPMSDPIHQPNQSRTCPIASVTLSCSPLTGPFAVRRSLHCVRFMSRPCQSSPIYQPIHFLLHCPRVQAVALESCFRPIDCYPDRYFDSTLHRCPGHPIPPLQSCPLASFSNPSESPATSLHTVPVHSPPVHNSLPDQSPTFHYATCLSPPITSLSAPLRSPTLTSHTFSAKSIPLGSFFQPVHW